MRRFFAKGYMYPPYVHNMNVLNLPFADGDLTWLCVTMYWSILKMTVKQCVNCLGY